MAKVSVIVPIYNVEKYIERCARSLFEQTLDDIEYIFVNDGTKDRSVEILNGVIDDYPQRKSQITVLHHERNMGLPQARKTGIMHAGGDFIAHCDSDDWVDTEMYKSMYELAIKENSDIVVCDYYKTNERKYSPKRGCRSTDKQKYIEDLAYKRSPWYLWNKIYKRSLYGPELIYPEDNMGEDIVLLIQKACKAEKISYIPKKFYYYYKNPTSIVRTKGEQSRVIGYEQQKRNTQIVVNVLSHYHSTSVRSGYQNYLLFYASRNLLPLAYHNNEFLRRWKEECPKQGLDFFFNSRIPFRHKLKYPMLMLLYYIKIHLHLS